MSNHDDEEVPYRSPFDLNEVTEDKTFSEDEAQEPTLRRVYKILKGGLEELDKWHAFDLVETEMKLKQQIKAHALAASILAPAVEEVRQALATIDEKFKQRNL
jgi:hypothetical protein